MAGAERGVARRNAGEIILFAEAAVDSASYAGGERPLNERRASANQNGERDFGVRFVGIGEEPADMGLLV